MWQSAGNLQQPRGNKERRIKDRFAAPSLKVELRRRGLLGWRRGAVPVDCLDINRYGMAVLSPVPVNTGSRLVLDFDGKYITQSDVGAQVVSATPSRAGFRLGLQFCYCTGRANYSRTVDNALSRIEALYRKRRPH